MHDWMTQIIASMFCYALMRILIGDKRREKFRVWIESQSSGKQLALVGLLFLWSFVAVLAVVAWERASK